MKLAKLLTHQDVIEYSILQGKVGVMAVHGGNIERGTEQIAVCIAQNSNSSLYVISPRTQKRDWKFHISSNKISPRDSEKLAQFLEHVSTAISIHGHVIKRNVICVGGLNQALRRSIVQSLREDFDVVDAIEDGGICRNLSAKNPKNVVNLTRDKGVQIEIPLLMRKAFKYKPCDEMPTEETRLLVTRLVETIQEFEKSFEE
ncbi:MAG: poly-gamma-glutamate hydrolase family protein [Theionarchaea archaeon]|nr:poly-gamma-glutamate hydrolase family protein [Theionarchaea archaeon]MBU6999314.1 poly-gamma-glutamate hydrolase family protein [Theionarchaea archaeon]MBU7019561.1 poly-gamma-glutamate hydrolase family protein [Theionarchaea archaeon]MBU7033739.1 poly-gamma-glutamate hydrolase family protein [Theionarchaea archaeon]MBU7039451.1 poly-gamma-glutamate hydrolase family protein [Theionarchaea archaeon]